MKPASCWTDSSSPIYRLHTICTSSSLAMQIEYRTETILTDPDIGLDLSQKTPKSRKIRIRIRIQHFQWIQIRIRIQSRFRVLSDDQNLNKKIQLKNIFSFFWSKIAICLSLGLHKGHQSHRRSFSPLKRTSRLQKLRIQGPPWIHNNDQNSKHISPRQPKLRTECEEDYPVPVHNVYAVRLWVRNMLLHEASEPGEVGRDARDTCNHNGVKISKVYLGSMYTAVLVGWDPANPPIPRIWAHIRGRYWSAERDDIS